MTYTYAGKTKAEIEAAIERYAAAVEHETTNAQLAERHAAKAAWWASERVKRKAELLAMLAASTDEVIVTEAPDATVERPKPPTGGTSTPAL